MYISFSRTPEDIKINLSISLNKPSGLWMNEINNLCLMVKLNFQIFVNEVITFIISKTKQKHESLGKFQA